jgi:hypothetical protein
MQEHKGGEQRRAYDRKKVLVEVRWLHRKSEGSSAELCDVSLGGAYLSPLGEVPDDVGKDSVVWMVLPGAEGDEVISGIVRWRGFSREHGVIGFGIEFEEASKGTVKRLFGALCA